MLRSSLLSAGPFSLPFSLPSQLLLASSASWSSSSDAPLFPSFGGPVFSSFFSSFTTPSCFFCFLVLLIRCSALPFFRRARFLFLFLFLHNSFLLLLLLGPPHQMLRSSLLSAGPFSLPFSLPSQLLLACCPSLSPSLRPFLLLVLGPPHQMLRSSLLLSLGPFSLSAQLLLSLSAQHLIPL